MRDEIKAVRIGLLLVMLTLAFGIGLGVTFGIAEDSIQNYISNGIALHPDLLKPKSQGGIWRFAQRAHFHATGVAAFSLGLIILTMLSSLKANLKKITAILIGLGGLYPAAWFTMFILSPSIGIRAAHHHFLTETFTYIGVGGLLLGMLLLSANLFLDMFSEKPSGQ